MSKDSKNEESFDIVDREGNIIGRASRQEVAWFGDAPPEIGGWGATLVELAEKGHQ